MDLQPVITGPVEGGTHGFPATATPVDLSSHRYIEREYFLSGKARAYEADGEWGIDGRWSVKPASTAPYVTRLLVRRPEDAAQHNGTVVVEWFNVSSSVDVDPDFGYLADELLRGGYAWVGVSAQAAGVMSTGGGSFGGASTGHRDWDPERYGSLHHPGDAYSYDVFSQTGSALRQPAGVDPLDGLRTEVLLATGESQSAMRLLTYVNAVHPLARVFDGFLVHSRSGGGAPLGEGLMEAAPAPARVRTDLDVPVLQVQTETDLFGLAGEHVGHQFPSARQPDTDLLRTWEVAGTSHADAHYLRLLHRQGLQQFGDFLDLTGAFDVVNDGPQHWVMHTALRGLRRWVTERVPPPVAPPIEVADAAIVRDANGNALGGLRLPQVDVPVAVLSGEGGGLTGSTTRFDEAALLLLHGSRQAFLGAFSTAVGEAVAAGYVLSEDAPAMVEAATAAWP